MNKLELIHTKISYQLYIYLAQIETQQIRKIFLFRVKIVWLIWIMLVCIAHNGLLCFTLNNEQMTFKLKKVNFQGHGPADHDPTVWVIWL